MQERIEKYLVEEQRVESPVVRKMLREKVTKYEDIAEEFCDGWGRGSIKRGWRLGDIRRRRFMR